jgi:ElaB/YqjD/DUF883 family membrane-anchored ribosome-binding protein
LKALNPTKDYIEDLKDRLDVLEYGEINDVCKTDDGPPSTSLTTFSLVQRCIDETTLYIRMRVPDEFLMETDYVKQLTLDVIKFGITYSVNSRNGQYARDRDNGYMAFSFHCPSRKEAQIVEDIMRYDFSKIAVLNSYEYVDATAVSEILGVEFDNTSYDSYVGVAQALYKYMLRLVHTVWSRNSHMYGYSYDIVANNSTLVHNIENDTTSIHSDLSFKCSVIDEERAVALGLTEARALTPPPIVEEVTVPDPMTKISLEGIEHRGDLTVDDVVDNAPKLANDPLKMHEKFDKFVDEMCIIDPEGLTGSTEMTANFRMWSRESGRDLFLSTSNYMDKRFGKTRIPGADKHTVVNGYKGVRIKPKTPYVLPTNPTIREQFLYEMCDRGVTFKSRQLDLINIFKDWFQKKNGEAPSDVQVRSLKTYMENNFFKTNVHMQTNERKAGQGYWGVKLKADDQVHRHVSTTSKSIQKLNVETMEHVREKPWVSIAKAAECEGIPATKMSRYVRDKTNVDGFMYVTV